MIYVDELFTAVPRTVQARRYGTTWCHMFTDGDIEELHTLAQKIGLKKAWFQAHPRLAHYDLTPSKRVLAIQQGAIEIKALDYWRKRRGEL